MDEFDAGGAYLGFLARPFAAFFAGFAGFADFTGLAPFADRLTGDCRAGVFRGFGFAGPFFTCAAVFAFCTA